MKIIKTRIKLIDAKGNDLGITDLNASYEPCFVVADQIAMIYPNSDEDTGEDTTTIELKGGQSHQVYETFNSFIRKFHESLPDEITIVK